MDELNAKWGYIGYNRIRHIFSSKTDDVDIFTNSELCKLIDFVNKIHVTGQNVVEFCSKNACKGIEIY